jgi:hypothetical protein
MLIFKNENPKKKEIFSLYTHTKLRGEDHDEIFAKLRGPSYVSLI